MQNMMNILYRGASVADRGTMFQLKNDFRHRGVTNDVMNSFNHVDNFVRFSTEAHVVYLALKLAGMADMTSEPPGGDAMTPDDRQQLLSDTAERVVRELWLLPPVSDVTDVIECVVNDDFVTDAWCTCDEGQPMANFNQC